MPRTFIPYRSIVPLREIVAQSFDMGVASKKVAAEYARLIKVLGNEFSILLHVPLTIIEENVTNKNIALAIGNMRENKVALTPGYDGVYGTADLFSGGKYTGPKQSVLL